MSTPPTELWTYLLLRNRCKSFSASTAIWCAVKSVPNSTPNTTPLLRKTYLAIAVNAPPAVLSLKTFGSILHDIRSLFKKIFSCSMNDWAHSLTCAIINTGFFISCWIKGSSLSSFITIASLGQIAAQAVQPQQSCFY